MISKKNPLRAGLGALCKQMTAERITAHNTICEHRFCIEINPIF